MDDDTKAVNNSNSVPRGEEAYESMLTKNIEEYQRSLEEEGVGQLEISYKTLKFIFKPPESSFRRWIGKSGVRKKFIAKEERIIKDMCFALSIRKKLLDIFVEDVRRHHEDSYHLSFISHFISDIYEELEDKESLLEDLRDIIRNEFLLFLTKTRGTMKSRHEKNSYQ